MHVTYPRPSMQQKKHNVPGAESAGAIATTQPIVHDVVEPVSAPSVSQSCHLFLHYSRSAHL